MSFDEEKMALCNEAIADIKKMYGLYGTTSDFQTPAHVVKRLQAILDAATAEAALLAKKKALDSAHIHILSKLNTKTVAGVDNCRTWNKKINKAKSLAQMLEAKGQMQAAIRQWEKVKALEEKLANCKTP